MDFPETEAVKKDVYEEQLEALDLTIRRCEEILHEADKGIDQLIKKRGVIAEHVQHLWNQRHRLQQDFEAIKEETRRRGNFFGGAH